MIDGSEASYFSLPDRFICFCMALTGFFSCTCQQLIIHALIPLGVGIGIHLVGSVGGREEGSFKYALLAASLPVPLIIQEANTLS